MTTTSEFGMWSEDFAAKYLKERGYKILDQNYTKPWGEIDIVAEKDDLLIFTEVKANKKEVAGFEPENRISPDKLKRLNRVIQTYLASKKYSHDQEWQVDVLALTVNRERGVISIKHFKNIDL